MVTAFEHRDPPDPMDIADSSAHDADESSDPEGQSWNASSIQTFGLPSQALLSPLNLPPARAVPAEGSDFDEDLPDLPSAASLPSQSGVLR